MILEVHSLLDIDRCDFIYRNDNKKSSKNDSKSLTKHGWLTFGLEKVKPSATEKRYVIVDTYMDTLDSIQDECF